MAAETTTPKTRELELALFQKIDARLDKIDETMTEVRDKVIRIEAQDPAARVVQLETRVRELEEWKSKVSGQVALVVVPIAAGIGAVMMALTRLFVP